MVVETATSLAAPWPLKVILDNVVGTHKAPEWLAPFRSLLGEHKMALALLAGMATVIIALLGAVASYIDNYYTERGPVGWHTLYACGSMIICSTSRSGY